MKKLTQDEFEKRIDVLQESQYEVLGQYKGKRKKIKIRCKKCGLTWEPLASILLTKRVGNECKHKINLTPSLAKRKIEIASNGKINMLGHYSGAKVPTLMLCNVCNYEWKTEPFVVYSGHGCPRCAGKAKITEKTIKEFLLRNKLPYKLLSPATNSKEKVKFKHDDHYFFMSSHNLIVSGQRCPHESYTRRAKSNSYSFEKMAAILEKQTKGRYKLVGDYKNANSNAVCLDTKCGRSFLAHPGQLSRNERGCPYCYSSKGEQAIREFLEKRNIKYREQVKFEDCKNINYLPFDFAVYSNDKLLYLIEFQGLQHYKAIDVFGGEETLKKRQERDKIKSDWCLKNNIPLLAIPYKSDNSSFSNIKQIVDSYLNKYMLIPNQASQK